MFGVPDAQWGEAIKAVLEVQTTHTLTVEQVRESVGSRIARYKRPQWVEFPAALPRNTAGMVDHTAVQTRLGQT